MDICLSKCHFCHIGKKCDSCGDGKCDKCGKPRCVRKLVKRIVTEEECTTKCIAVEKDCAPSCSGCGGGAGDPTFYTPAITSTVIEGAKGAETLPNPPGQVNPMKK